MGELKYAYLYIQLNEKNENVITIKHTYGQCTELHLQIEERYRTTRELQPGDDSAIYRFRNQKLSLTPYQVSPRLPFEGNRQAAEYLINLYNNTYNVNPPQNSTQVSES